MVDAQQYDVVLVSLDPTVGSEIQKTRPCVVVSPDDMNAYLRTIIVAPMTSKGKPARFRVPITFDGKKGRILLDQVRTIDKKRLQKNLGHVARCEADAVSEVLLKMFE